MGNNSKPSDADIQGYYINSLLGGNPQGMPTPEPEACRKQQQGPRSAQELIRRQINESRGSQGRA